MKKIIYIICFLLPVMGVAQKIAITKQTEIFGAISLASYTVYFDTLTAKDVSKAWTGYLKDHEAKVKSSKEETLGDNAKILSLSSDTVDVFSKIKEDGKGALLIVSLQTKEGIVSENEQPSKVAAAEAWIRTFAVSLSKKIVEERIQAAQKLLQRISNNVSELEERNKNLASSNEKMRKEIAENEKEFAENIPKIEDLKKATEAQAQLIKQIQALKQEIE
ncbi:MAG: hypothetical protein RIQ89_1842 [Bacteroidota bacterium]|jgi:hypothetical protein